MSFVKILFAACLLPAACYAQDDLSGMFKDSAKRSLPVIATFKSTRIINGQSNETLGKNELDFRVGHRFGDMAGSNGGAKTFFGMDNSTDIRIAFEYGVSDNLTVGIGRSKGSGNLSQLYEGLVKYRLLQQTTDNRIPLAITLFGNAVVSAMESAEEEASPAYFGKFSDRMSYTAQAVLARQFGHAFSLAVLPTYVHRNRVGYADMNGMFALGVGGRLRFTNRLALVVDYFVPFRDQASKDFAKTQGMEYYNSLGVGLEIETGGHVFHVNFTNSTATLENQFIPETTSTWTNGQFRWGFNISRRFDLDRKHKH
ncbi:DUF5777 family beta-barrel protein [Chitinophaga horti]|uniref:DUF5777 family beta-barrel protein n=1 Tax=Chitinophaga horti TaxID=2920382 RepID=A0ABY6J0Q7_9BACT|nr:DUF5777 family beta-barrel protein [Chitinophaga horti]UYQ93215.1 DUF5777 family beta-barrel protein [Chitinophaga horti]